MLILTAWLGFSNFAYSSVIYQAFNERFVSVSNQAASLAESGYRIVQVSPPIKTIDESIWWGRYQPIDYRRIEGPLGNERQFLQMIETLHDHGLKVIVDVVLNHMADPVFSGLDLDFPEFMPWDFHHPDTRPCIQDWDNRDQVTNYWLCDPAFPDRRLPDLVTQSQYVRDVHKRFLRRMLRMGVDGFRIDAVKHIEPEYFGDVLSVIPRDKIFYGEVIGRGLWEAELYTPYMRVSDFQLLSVMLSAFSIGGNLSDLVDPESYGAALPGDKAVVFARNHDTAMHQGFFNFGDQQDWLLATSFVVARGVGLPVVYRDDAHQRIVRKGVMFHNLLASKSTYVRRMNEICGGCSTQNMLAIERGGVGLMILNKANEWVDVARARMPGLRQGCYRELMHDFYMQVDRGGDGQKWVSAWGSASRGGLAIGPRSAMFFVKTPQHQCDEALK
jgi:alpha-amylase